MMRRMRAADFAMSQILPPDLHQPSYDFTAKGIESIMARVAREHPDKYAEIAKKVGDLGRNAAWTSGFTLKPQDLLPVIDTKSYLRRMDAELKMLDKERGLSEKDRGRLRNEVMLRYSDLINKDTAAAATANRNSVAMATQSGARGNSGHLQAILSTPGVYADAKDNVIPLFVRSSFAEGIRPAESLAGTYGGRKAIVSTKRATAMGGFMSKMLAQLAARYNVTTKDCGTSNGVDMEPDDPSLRGRVLARPAAGYDAGTVIDRHVLMDLRKAGKPVVARSPMTCGARHGLCSKCFGVESNGRLPEVGTSLGEIAANSIGEPLTQSALNVKHGGGQAKGGKKSFSGFGYISQFVQVPDEFKDKAAVSEKDGMVEAVTPAPQGGHYISVDGERHYALPGFSVLVKPGQNVEKGQALSDGLVNPADVVRLRGLGEGRRYFADRFEKILQDSGQPPNRRRVELIARAAVDNYRVTDFDDEHDWMPDDTISEADLNAAYQKPANTTKTKASKAIGQYLQAPALHYTIGTKITPTVAERLDKVGFEVEAADKAPSAVPEMRRLQTATHGSGDWLVDLSTSYLKQQMRTNVEKATDTNVESNYHYAPRLAVGVGFGENVGTTGKF